MKHVLTTTLGYTSSEVSSMKPDVAAVVIQRMLRRPAVGMPKPWYKAETSPPDEKDRGVGKKLVKIARFAKKVSKVAVPVLAAAFVTQHALSSSVPSHALTAVNQGTRSALSALSVLKPPAVATAPAGGRGTTVEAKRVLAMPEDVRRKVEAIESLAVIEADEEEVSSRWIPPGE